MAITSYSEFRPIPATPDALEKLAAALEARWGKELRISVSYSYEGGGSDIVSIARDSLVTLTPVAPPIVFVSLTPKGSLLRFEVRIFVRSDRVSIGARDETMLAANALKALAVEALGVEPLPEAEEPERVSSLERRVDAVQRIQEEALRIRAFLSFRFGEPDSSLAADVERFLTLSNVEVVTGRSYEPRRVEDKVRSRLVGVDIVVYLLTSSGDSSWVRDEIAAAGAVGIPVVPLVEDTAQFEQGLFGNVEWIRFSAGHIGDVWIRLTEAVRFVRAEKARSLDSR